MKNLIPMFLCMAADDVLAGAAGQPTADSGLPPKNELGAKNLAAAAAKADAMAEATGSLGVEATLTVLKFVVALEQAVVAAEADDGKITIVDAMKLAPVVPLVGPMIGALHAVPAEIGDLDEHELELVLEEASVMLGGAGKPATILKVKAALKFADAGYELFLAFKK